MNSLEKSVWEMKMKVKICGIKSVEEAKVLVENNADYMGMVLFFPKSKRNISEKKAAEIVSFARNQIKTVAVVVSPSIEQVEAVKNIGFDFIQIHGTMPEGIKDISIIKAFNVDDINQLDLYMSNNLIEGILFDAPQPGSGKTFDWNMLDKIDRKNKMLILAGGLTAGNVKEGIAQVKPDIVDVSSGVEYVKGGKDPKKVEEFIKIAKSGREDIEQNER